MRATQPGRSSTRWRPSSSGLPEAGRPSWGYPSIVGSGPNATTLHYDSSRRQMKDGELLLVDAAAFYQGITADITRTYR